jgi:hypothetical protein
VNASGRTSVLSGYAEVAAGLGLDDGGDAEPVAARFAAWLTGTARPWFLVLDDLRDAADLDAGSGCPPVPEQAWKAVLALERAGLVSAGPASEPTARVSAPLKILLALSSDCGTYGGRHQRTVWFLVQYPASGYGPVADAGSPGMPPRVPGARGAPVPVPRWSPGAPGWPAVPPEVMERVRAALKRL